ncbi:DUF4440 domain-containing protein [Actinobacillus succinogenes]|uniref:DUF4440 domain-containing protein n=1 Tax=Actinobacillus succinogenes (strain ATCC 55618 / DSM 22257 / CCUG 43843 / 130Z) TaxID=339671 RepID=A6VR33_ACTSZ|nr:nuclear transport factor 2 family protein [Actinobacillus succinogenes]ABR75430.1 hypothetical protein Asuc_2084 [Actinobacillus succinogenes 130Z]PHI40182.1 DUF4440 domain-containing protein [Actinobacillus succinogenes]
MIKPLILTVILGVSACTYADTAPPEQTGRQTDKQTMNDEQVLTGIYRRINRAMLDKDSETIDRLTADGFTLTHITGYKQSKSEWLNHIETGKMQYHQIDEHSVNVRINGNTADVIGKARTRATIWGASGTWNLQLHYRAMKNGNVWQVQNAVATLF